MKIYVASSWRNNIQPVIVDFLRERGYEVYDFKNPPERAGFGWEQIAADWPEWDTGRYKDALEHPIAIEGFESDFNAMKEADACVLILPCGRSAHTEAGWMKGAGKKVIVYQITREEPELMYKLYDGIAQSGAELIEMLNM